MDKKDVEAIITNLNIAHQAAETRRAIERANEKTNAVMNETLDEIKYQTARIDAAEYREYALAEVKRSDGIEPDDMLPIERGFRTCLFDEDMDTFYWLDNDLPDAQVDRLEKEPIGAGKYFKWHYSIEEGVLELTQTEAWLLAKGVNLQQRRERLAVAKRAEEAEAQEREKERVKHEVEAKRATRWRRIKIVIGLVLLALWVRFVRTHH